VVVPASSVLIFLTTINILSCLTVVQYSKQLWGEIPAQYQYSILMSPTFSLHPLYRTIFILSPQLFSDTKFVNFEQSRIPKEFMRRVVEETLPKGFVFNIDKIEFVDYYVPVNQEYGHNTHIFPPPKMSREREPGVTYILAGAKANKIIITKLMEIKSLSEITRIILHEVAHTSGPGQNRFLIVREHIELVLKLLSRIKSSDRYHSSYVEEISNSNALVNNSNKITEYFAEIIEAYLSCKTLPAEDEEICREIIYKMDPSFNVKDAFQRRMLIIEKFKTGRNAGFLN